MKAPSMGSLFLSSQSPLFENIPLAIGEKEKPWRGRDVGWIASRETRHRLLYARVDKRAFRPYNSL